MKNYYKCDIKYSLFSLLFVFSGTLFANVTQYSPVYISFILSIVLLSLYLSFNGTIRTNGVIRYIWLFTLLIILYLFAQMIFTGSFSKMKDYFLYFQALLYLPLTIIFLYKFSLDELKKLISKYIIISTLVLISDTIARFIFPSDTKVTALYFFYNYKTNGIISIDSNVSGFFAMINFGFMLYLRDFKTLIFPKRYFVLHFIIILLCFSRAAIITTVLLLLFIKIRKLKSIGKMFLIIISIFITAIIFYLLGKSDGSFISKFEIFANTIKYIKIASARELLFGWGIYSNSEWLGLFRHNYISSSLYDIGIVGMALYLFLFLSFSIYIKRAFVYIAFPYLIAGLSFAPALPPYFSAITGMMYLLQKNRRQ